MKQQQKRSNKHVTRQGKRLLLAAWLSARARARACARAMPMPMKQINTTQETNKESPVATVGARMESSIIVGKHAVIYQVSGKPQVWPQ